MKTNKHRMIHLVGTMMLVMAMTVTMIGYAPQIALAAGGQATVTLVEADGLDPNTEFSFELYKVGHFEGPDFVLDDNLKDSKVDVDFPSGSDETDKAKAERMLESASQLSKYIDDNNISLTSIGGSHPLKPGESFSESVSENGLYLVRSNTVRDASGANFNWTPQPVYIMILNGDSSIEISNDVVVKIVKTSIQFRHRVKKTWVIPESAVDEKPSAIYVNIRYSGEVIDVIKLTSAGSWTYDWLSEEEGDQYKYIGHDVNGNEIVKEFTPDKSKPYWSADEILDSSEVTGWDLTDEEKAEIDRMAERFAPEYSGPKTINVGTGQDGETVQMEEYVINNPYHEPPTPPDDKVKTGDESNIRVWVAGLICACVLLAALFFLRKRQKRD